MGVARGVSSGLLISTVLAALASAGGCGSQSGSGASVFNADSGAGGHDAAFGEGGLMLGSSSSGGGSGGSSGTTSGSGGSSSGSPATGSPGTCIVGTQGCLCDTTGSCAPGLTCSPQT